MAMSDTAVVLKMIQAVHNDAVPIKTLSSNDCENNNIDQLLFCLPIIYDNNHGIVVIKMIYLLHNLIDYLAKLYGFILVLQLITLKSELKCVAENYAIRNNNSSINIMDHYY